MFSKKKVNSGSWRKRVVSTFAAVVVSSVAVFGFATPANASLSECRSGNMCVWSGANYATDWGTVGGFLNWSWCVDQFSRYWVIDDKATSVYNNGRSENGYLYRNANKSGARFTVLRGNRFSDLRKNGFNDMASSGYFSSGLGRVGTSACR